MNMLSNNHRSKNHKFHFPPAHSRYQLLSQRTHFHRLEAENFKTLLLDYTLHNSEILQVNNNKKQPGLRRVGTAWDRQSQTNTYGLEKLDLDE